MFDIEYSQRPTKVPFVFLVDPQPHSLFYVPVLYNEKLHERWMENDGDRYCKGSSIARKDVTTQIVGEWDHVCSEDLNLVPLAGHSHPETRGSMRSPLFRQTAFTLTILALRSTSIFWCRVKFQNPKINSSVSMRA